MPAYPSDWERPHLELHGWPVRVLERRGATFYSICDLAIAHGRPVFKEKRKLERVGAEFAEFERTTFVHQTGLLMALGRMQSIPSRTQKIDALQDILRGLESHATILPDPDGADELSSRGAQLQRRIRKLQDEGADSCDPAGEVATLVAYIETKHTHSGEQPHHREALLKTPLQTKTRPKDHVPAVAENSLYRLSSRSCKDKNMDLAATEEEPKPKATNHDADLKLPSFFLTPPRWPTLESLVCLFILSMGELQDNGDFRPALWSLVLVLAAAQALARTDRMYLLFWGDSLVEDFCAAVITGLALGYSLTTEFLFASILFGFSFFKTVRLICSRVRHPERELPTLIRRRRFTQVAIRWAGSVILVALGGLIVPCWGPVKYVCSEWWGHHYVWPHLWVVLEYVVVSFLFLLAASFCLYLPIGMAWLFVELSTTVFSLRELAFISEPGCGPNVRSRLMVLMRSQRGVEELNRLFLDLVAVGQDPAAIDVVLEHGAQVDTQGSLALRMACDPFGWASCQRRERHGVFFHLPSPRPDVGHDVTAPIVRCLLEHGATPPAGCAVGSLSVGTVSCLVEFGHREALYDPDTFGNAVRCNETAMIDYLMEQGADVDAGIRRACAFRYVGFDVGGAEHETVGDGLFTVLRNTQVTPLTDDTIDIVCRGDPIAAAVLLLKGTTTHIKVEEHESIARMCLQSGRCHLAVQMVINDLVPVESKVAEELLVEAVHSGGSSVWTPLMERLGSLRFPKRALDHALARALQDADADRYSQRAPVWYEAAKRLLQHGASLPVGYEEETARSHNARRAQFVREMDTAPLTKAAR